MMKSLLAKVQNRIRGLSILYKFTFIITLVFLGCFIALTALAKPVAANLAIEYAHRSMTQRLQVIRVEGFDNGEIDSAYIGSLLQAGELIAIHDLVTGEEVYEVSAMDAEHLKDPIQNLSNQHVIRVEMEMSPDGGGNYRVEMYADIDATIEPYLNAYYRYVIPLISTNGLLLTLAGVFTVMYLTRRIQTFTDKMRRIRENGYQEELPAASTEDEVGEMIHAFNEMINHFHELHDAQKQFVSDASHELKTPLAIIEGNAQLIEKWGERDPEILKESIPALRRGVDRAKMLIEDLLVLSRTNVVQAGPIPNVALQPLIENYIEDLRIIHPDVEFTLELSPIQYEMHAIDFNKLINIFIENGIKYSQDELEIGVQLCEVAGGFELRVSDSGIGISPEHQQRIFERFYRVDSSRSRDTGGNGIGLAVAKKIVLKYRGDIFVESVIGEGSTFVAFFPKIGGKHEKQS